MTEPQPLSLAPSGDRLLLFWSDVVVHDVSPCHDTADSAHRHTLTVWLSTQNVATLLNPCDPLLPLRHTHFPAV